ncbi:hypothetical protein GCM10009087_22170 [Sphingomonas oligophenolica]|uniref:Toll/interleukin-1 receptor domain-containing protein n=1 Tax=Sphingomonas oligophenolica TaxID=301154 RepID=A0ABU9Y3H6_9SPHN
MDDADRQNYVSPSKEWDVFLSHASEDKSYVRAVAAGLAKRGITYILDERDFVAGMSLRGQVDSAILNSYLGILFVSSHFMRKRWTREEFDGLFTLEDGGQTKIMPVWLGVDIKAVANFSPMLASRLAIVADEDADVTAGTIARHLEQLFTINESWGQMVRTDTLCLPWVGTPMFHRKSLKILDDYLPYFWVPRRFENELPGFQEAVPIRVCDTVIDPTGYDGRCVIVIGWQSLVQIYQRRDHGLREWVFQLTTNEPGYAQSIMYVRCAGPVDEGSGWPTSPQGDLTIVVGYIVAHGAMILADGSIANASYLVAAKVHHAPPVS